MTYLVTDWVLQLWSEWAAVISALWKTRDGIYFNLSCSTKFSFFRHMQYKVMYECLVMILFGSALG
jgi:hypothetical protein